MIGFVSAGFNPPYSLTLEETEFLRKCDNIIVDTFTSPFFMKEFEQKELIFSNREKLENFEWIFNLDGQTGIVISGDVFSATTHFNIYKEAIKKNINIKVFYNATIIPIAATRMGLHLYKIGPIISLPRFQQNFKPTSPYLKIAENLDRKLHSIILLDTNPPMSLVQAFDELTLLEKELKGGLFGETTKIGVVSSLGMTNERIGFGMMDTIKKRFNGAPPLTLVYPAELHFQEEENLSLFEL